MESRYRKLLLSVLSGCALLCGCEDGGAPAATQHFPERPDGTPFFNSSSITQANFEAIYNLDRVRNVAGIDMAMVMLASLPEGFDIEQYAAEIFEQWEVGHDSDGKGVVILLVEDIHSVKIEVAYELEPVFTDVFCGAYQETVRTYFANEHFGDVICRLIVDLLEKYQGNDVDPALLLSGANASVPVDFEKTFLSGGGGALESRYFYDKERKLRDILDASDEVIKRYDAQSTPGETVEKYLESMEAGVNYPFLGILNQGSHLMRIEYPKTRFFLQKTARSYRSSRPFKIFQQGDLAVARFADNSVFPFLLRRNLDDKWQIDVTKSWAYIQGSNDLSEYYPLFRDHAWMFAFPDYSYRISKEGLPDLLPVSTNLQELIATLESAIEADPENPKNYFSLSRILYFECYWIRSAIELVEKGLELDPGNVEARWLAITMRYRFPQVDGVPKHLEALLKITPEDREVWQSAHHFERYFRKDQQRIKRLEKDYYKRFRKKL